MRSLYVYLFFLLLSISMYSQEKSIEFPNDFFGIYTGTLEIKSENGEQTIPMEFHLLATDSLGMYRYKLVYGEGDLKQVRDYTLLEKYKEKGVYVVDENNGIMLKCRVLANKMYTLFEVNNTVITTFITFSEDYLDFEIIASNTLNKEASYGDDKANTEVLSYPITTIQRAMLKKQ